MASTQELIDSIIAAHGGPDRFKALTSVTTRFQFTGALLGLKRRAQHLIVTATVSTRSQEVRYRGVGEGPDEEWVYTPIRVWKQSTTTGKVLEARDDPREAFSSHALDTPWDSFHFIYFSGYALWQYINFPYLLARPDVVAEELPTHTETGQEWRSLAVTFPSQQVLASHSTKQTYYFDSNFQLRRHDYAPDVLAGSPAAHYVFDEVDVGGMKFPTFRRVVATAPTDDGAPVPLLFGPIPTLVHLVFLSFSLHGEDEKEVGAWALSEVPKS